MIKYNPTYIEGSWNGGWALDNHTISSVRIGPGPGDFKTQWTELGEALNQLKYKQKKENSSVIAEVMFDFLKTRKFHYYAIIPVCPSQKRKWQPLYEVAWDLGHKVNKYVDYKYLKKVKATTQLKSIESAKEKREILKNSFTISDKNKYKGKNILLIDDLYDSGSTLNEICDTLKREGSVDRVYVVTVTKTRTGDKY